MDETHTLMGGHATPQNGQNAHGQAQPPIPAKAFLVSLCIFVMPLCVSLLQEALLAAEAGATPAAGSGVGVFPRRASRGNFLL